ncbi:MAG: transglutaminase-like domain-containing protein [Candidatus Buchananbacteria bacterium]
MPTLRRPTINAEKIKIEQPESAARTKREELFAQITEQKNRRQTLEAAKRVFEHSVEDGLQLNSRLNLNEEELAEVVMSPGFVIKHNQILKDVLSIPQTLPGDSGKKVWQALKNNKKHWAIIEKMIDFWDNHVLPARESKDWSEFEEKLEQERDLRRGNKLLDKIDSYYAPLLKTRQIMPAKVHSEYPVGEKVKGLKAGETREIKSSEQLADEALWQQQLLLFPTYYSESVREIIRRYQKQHRIEGEFRLSADEIFIVTDDIEKECDRLGIPFEDIKPRLKHARYISSTVGIKTLQAENGLVKKLNESLKNREQKVQLTGDKYEVVEDKEKGKEKEKPSDGWDDMTPEQAVNVRGGSFTINGRQFDMRSRNNGTAVVSTEIGGKNCHAGEALMVQNDLVAVERIGRKLKIIEKGPEWGGPNKIQEVTLDVDKIRRLEAGEKKEKKPHKRIEGKFLERIKDEDIYQLGGIKVKLGVVNDGQAFVDCKSWAFITDTFPFISRIDSLYYEDGTIYLKGVFKDGGSANLNIDIGVPGQRHGIDADDIKLRAKYIEKIENLPPEGRIEAKLLTEKSLGRDVYELAGMKLGFTDMSSMVRSGGFEGLYNIDTGRITTEGFVPFKKVNELYYENGKINIIGKYEKNSTGSFILEIRDEQFIEQLKKFQLAQEKKTEQKEFDFAKFEDKALDYIDKLIKDGADEDYIAMGLSGLDSDRAWEMREQFIKDGIDKNYIAWGLSGLDSDRAWEMREQFIKDGVDKGHIAMGLSGLDSDRAWEMREQFIKDGADKDYITWGLSGLDSDRAWEMREQFIKDGVDKDFIAAGLSGLNSDRAWEMREQFIREQFIKDGVHKNYIAAGLSGLDSDRAWEMREQFIKDGIDKGYIAEGLAGLDSDRAWEMREQFIKDGVGKGYITWGLSGLDSDRAWEMREQFIKDGVDKGHIAGGLAGDYITFVWQLKLKEKTNKAKELTKEEQERLDTLNLLHHPTSDKIYKHFAEKNTKEKGSAKPGWKKLLSGNRFVTGIINRIISEEPKLFLDTLPAKRDRLPEVFAQQLSIKIFPEILQAEKETAWHGFSGYSGLERGGRPAGSAGPEDCLNPNSNQELVGGGIELMNDDREVMEFREALGSIIATNIYGRYNPSSKRWETVDFSVSAPLIEPAIETTATLPNVKNLSAVSLPKTLEARIIPERVKGFDAQGREHDLEIEVNNLGEAKVVNKPSGVEKIVYSIAVAQAPEPLRDLNQREYKLFKKQLETTGGQDLTKILANIPEDLELELLSVIEGKNPKEQVMAIERLVRDLGYYDQNNQEVNELKRGKPLEEQLYVMEQRLEELRQQKPELAPELRGKKFAGVCADFAQLTATLLRRAGLASGVIVGFGGQDKIVRMKHAHATAFVVWPDEAGKSRVISVDGTPDGVIGVSLPSLVEQEQESISKEKGQSAEAIKRVQEIIDGLNRLDAETVRKMSNGELERVLNSILKYQVKESHLAIIESLLNYYWYTPIHQLDLANPYQQGEAILELAGAVDKERRKLAEQPEKDETPAGNKLMQMMQDFLGRFVVAGATEDKNAAVNLMEKIVELAQNDLSEVEKKAAFAVLAYLKAKNILGNKL